MPVSGGYSFYGAPLGILMLETRFPRIPGDIGNAASFGYPVHFHIVRGASVARVVLEQDEKLLEPFIEAAQTLEKLGVRVITTSCGFLAMFQKHIARQLRVPFFSSSLMQIPWVSSLLPPGTRLGVLTARKDSLTEKHFSGVDVDASNLLIGGMDNSPEFCRTFIEGNSHCNASMLEQEMLAAALELQSKGPLGAIVLECTNMPPFSQAIHKATGLPVFDCLSLANYVVHAHTPRGYPS